MNILTCLILIKFEDISMSLLRSSLAFFLDYNIDFIPSKIIVLLRDLEQ